MRLLPASAGEEYYLRAILCVIKGADATSWTALKTVDNQYVILKNIIHLININNLFCTYKVSIEHKRGGGDWNKYESPY